MVTLRASHWSPPPQLASDWLELVAKSLPSRLHFHSLRLAQWRRPGWLSVNLKIFTLASCGRRLGQAARLGQFSRGRKRGVMGPGPGPA